MKTFRARLAFWMAASALSVLLISGVAVYSTVRSTLQEKQDEALLEITRTEIESPTETENVDPPEIDRTDESLLAWNVETGKIFLERGTVSLRAARRPAPQTDFTDLSLSGRSYRALYYPYAENGVRAVALCAVPAAPLRSALASIAARIVALGFLGAALTCFLSWRISARLTRPLEEIARFTRGVGEADLNRRLESRSRDAELLAVADGLNAMLSRIEAAFLAQRRFVADAAHELRSPLANLRTTAEVALRRKSPETRERALQLTVSEVERLTGLAESLMTLSLADSGALLRERASADLGALAREAVEAVRSRAEGQGVSLSVAADRASLLHGDALRLRQVFDNLLDNSLRHTASGDAVQVVVRKESGEIQARVKDSGPGISEADLPHVFERLWRADSARARTTGGFGLGLATVKAIVEAHGGSVRVDSVPFRETTFELRFPVD